MKELCNDKEATPYFTGEWEKVNLGLLCHIKTGSRDVNEGCGDGIYPFFTCSRDVYRANTFTFNGEAILIAGNGEVGNLHYYNGKFEAYQRTYVLMDFVAEVKYLYQYLDSFLIKRLNEGKVGSSIPYIVMGQLEYFSIDLPTPAEQRAIAKVLGNVDKLIENLEKRLVKKRAIKQGAMQELLTGKKRLPGFTGEWEKKRLGSFCDIVMGQSPASSHYNFSGIGLPLIQGNADIVNRWSFIRNYTSEITKVCEAGDIIMSVRAPVGAVGRASFDSCIGRGICAFKTDSLYLYFYLLFVEDKWAEFSKGSTFDSINSQELYNYEIVVPPSLSEQRAIAKVLSDMDDEISVLERKLEKVKQVKQGMMQDLLTGKVRLRRQA